MRWKYSVSLVSAVFFIFWNPLIGQEDPISPEKIKAARDLVQEVYRDKFRLRKPEEIKSFIRELLDQGKKTDGNRAQQYVLFLEARDLAVKTGDTETALEAESELANLTGDPRLQDREELLKTLSRRVRDKKGYLFFAEVYMQLGADYELINDFGGAGDALSKAYAFAKRSRDKELYTAIALKKKQNDYVEKKFKYAVKAMQTLVEHPDDGDANLQAGEFFCFVRGDWDKGLPFLVKSSHNVYADIAKRDLELQKSVEKDDLFGVNAIVKLAEDWLAAAEDEREDVYQGNIAARSAMWFGQALPSMSGLAQKALEKKITQAEKLAAGAGGAAVGTIPYGAVFIMTFNKNSVVEQNGITILKEGTGNGPDYELTDGELRTGKAGEGLFSDLRKDGTKSQSFKLGKAFGSPVSFSFWVRINGWKEVERFRGFCPFGTGGATKISINPDGSILYGPSLKNDAHSEKGAVKAGVWTHIGIVVKGKKDEPFSDKSIVFYVDGKQVQTDGFRGVHDSFSLNQTRFGNVNYDGMIDEFVIYERPLSEKEIKQLYFLGKAGKTLK